MQLGVGDLNRGVRSSGLQNVCPTTEQQHQTATATGVQGSCLYTEGCKGGALGAIQTRISSTKANAINKNNNSTLIFENPCIDPRFREGSDPVLTLVAALGSRCSGDERLKKREDINITQRSTTK